MNAAATLIPAVPAAVAVDNPNSPSQVFRWALAKLTPRPEEPGQQLMFTGLSGACLPDCTLPRIKVMVDHSTSIQTFFTTVCKFKPEQSDHQIESRRIISAILSKARDTPTHLDATLQLQSRTTPSASGPISNSRLGRSTRSAEARRQAIKQAGRTDEHNHYFAG